MHNRKLIRRIFAEVSNLMVGTLGNQAISGRKVIPLIEGFLANELGEASRDKGGGIYCSNLYRKRN